MNKMSRKIKEIITNFQIDFCGLRQENHYLTEEQRLIDIATNELTDLFQKALEEKDGEKE